VPGAPPALGPARAASPAPPPQAPPAPAARPAPTVAPPGTPPATARAAEPEGAGPLATAPWNALAGAAAGLTLGFVALVACGQVLGASAAMEEAALQRGEQIADVLGARNAALLAEQRGLDGLDVNVVTERDGVRDALLTDERGTVLAPAKRLRTSVSSHAAWKDAARSRTYARAAKDDGTWEIVAPIRAEVGNAGVKQVVGYAVLEVDPAQTVDRLYGPAGRIGVILLATLMAGGALAGAAWALVLRPLTALRDETELALRGDSDRVSAPVRLAPLEALAHSINRVLARARSRGEG
jgi:HAMP domain-containing protein